MTTVGYGDVSPTNELEQSFATVTMLITGVIFAYSVSTIGTILTNINAESESL
jgi:hypothetical protein